MKSAPSLASAAWVKSTWHSTHNWIAVLHSRLLPADVAANGERMRRFIQEAKAAAALNHPNIAHIYEVGESEGSHFIAMEHVEGETLREEIHHKKTPLNKLLRYLAQVAEGLAKAHAAGIVHRDLKPDNINSRHKCVGRPTVVR